MPSIGTCFRFYTQMRVQKKTKLLPIKLKTVYTTVNGNFLKMRVSEIRVKRIRVNQGLANLKQPS